MILKIRRILVLVFTVGDDGTMTLEQQDAPQLLRQGLGSRLTILPDDAAQPGKFAVVGGEDGGSLSVPQYILMPGQVVYAIGIHHNGTVEVFQHCPDCRQGALALPSLCPRPGPMRTALSRGRRSRIWGTASGLRVPPSSGRGNTTGSLSFTASMA